MPELSPTGAAIAKAVGGGKGVPVFLFEVDSKGAAADFTVVVHIRRKFVRKGGGHGEDLETRRAGDVSGVHGAQEAGAAGKMFCRACLR